MNRRQNSDQAALRRIQTFLVSNAEALGEVNASPPRPRIDELIREFDANAAAQAESRGVRKSLTASKHRLRRELRSDHIAPIVEVARRVKHTAPGLSGLRMPDKDLNDADLIAYARAVARLAAKRERLLTSEGLPPGSVKELRVAIDAVQMALGEQGNAHLKGVQATEKLADLRTAAGQVIRLLHALVVRKLGRSSSLLAGWRSAKRRWQKPGRRKR